MSRRPSVADAVGADNRYFPEAQVNPPWKSDDTARICPLGWQLLDSEFSEMTGSLGCKLAGQSRHWRDIVPTGFNLLLSDGEA